jgi:hypothetical protein
MESTVYAGLAVTSDDRTTATRAVFTHVSVTTGVMNKAPTVSLTSPRAGQSFTAPASIGLSATASDPDGTIARVDFYAGSKLLGSDGSSPYTLAWSSVPRGTYQLIAVARDNSGARTASAAASVTVSSVPSPPRLLSFRASADHTKVTRYVFEIFAAGSSVTRGPVRTQDIGKPAVVNGYVTADVGTTIRALAEGTYFATVSAVNAAGRTRSSPSNPFTR